MSVEGFSEGPDGFDVYRGLVESIPAIFYLDRPDERSTNFYTSPQAVDLLGYSAEEWGTTPDFWMRIIHPDDRDRVLEEDRLSNEGANHFFSEYRMIAKDGRIVWIRDEAVLVVDDVGAPLHWRGMMLDITPEKEAEEKLRQSLEMLRRTSQQRRQLVERLESAQEQERRRIAADIHDDSIQVMSAVDTRIQTLAMRGGADPAALQQLHETVGQAISRLRNLLFELLPSSLDHDGLAATLRLFLERSAAEDGLAWSLDIDGLLTEPAAGLRAALFRIAREAVVNVRKHASASTVGLFVATSASGVILRVSDDGRGFDSSILRHPEPGHLGLSTSIERAEVIGGWVRVSSVPGAGTTVECWLPADTLDGIADPDGEPRPTSDPRAMGSVHHGPRGDVPSQVHPGE